MKNEKEVDELTSNENSQEIDDMIWYEMKEREACNDNGGKRKLFFSENELFCFSLFY
jgi:hypothetical protein